MPTRTKKHCTICDVEHQRYETLCIECGILAGDLARAEALIERIDSAIADRDEILAVLDARMSFGRDRREQARIRRVESDRVLETISRREQP
jgi:hypothetical protein